MAIQENNQLTFDVAVVGAGPGGSTVASYLAKAGKKVIVFERERFPRFHIGESLLPHNLPLLEELGLMEQMEKRFIRKYAANFSDRGGTRTVRYPFAEAISKKYPYAYEVERSEFDLMLAENASTLGAEVRFGWSVNKVIFENDQAVGVEATEIDSGQKITVRCPVVVDASGQSILMGKRLGLKRKSMLKTRAAFFTHFENAQREPGDREGDIQIVAYRYGWFWMIPFKGNTTSVGVVINEAFLAGRKKEDDLETSLWRAINETPYVKDRLKNATQKWPAKSIGNYSYGMKRYAGNGFVMVGDAGAFLDPVFSSGVFLAMKSAQLASESILACFSKNDFSASRFRAYEHCLRNSQKLFFRFINGWYDPAFLDLFFIPKNILGVRSAIVTVLAADVFNPRYLWSLKLRVWLMFAMAMLNRWRCKYFRRGSRSLIQQQPI